MSLANDKRYPDIPWLPFEGLHEAEAWLDLYNHELQQELGNRTTQGQGVCFTLAHGGEVYLHTNGEGDILLDVTPEAAWVQPVLTAITQASPPRGQYWLLPGDLLMQLLLGLNTLIASTRLVLQHVYRPLR